MSSDSPFDRPGALRGTMHGVVEPRDVRVYHPGRRAWLSRVVFQLVAWRLDGGAVETRRLVVAREVLFGTGWVWRRRIRPGAAISFHSPGIELGRHGQRYLRLGRSLGPSADPALIAAAAPMLRRDTLVTADFGALVREPGGDHYSGAGDWHGTTVRLAISGGDRGEAERTLEHARALHAGWAAWEDQLRALVARELLPLWLDWNPDEPPVDADGLFAQLTLNWMWVMDDGGVQIEFDATGYFTDHSVMVYGTVAGGPADVHIEG